MNPDISGGGHGGYATNFNSVLTGGAESQVIAAVFKTMITRFVDSFKDLKENVALYCDVRQLVTYVKGAHGGAFRRVALSGILAVTPRPHKKAPSMQTTRVIRLVLHFLNWIFTSNVKLLFSRHIPQSEMHFLQQDEKQQRKLLFKKRSTSSTCAVIRPNLFDSTVERRYLTILFSSSFCRFLHKVYWKQTDWSIKIGPVKVHLVIFVEKDPAVQYSLPGTAKGHYCRTLHRVLKGIR
jgi:Protein UNC80